MKDEPSLLFEISGDIFSESKLTQTIFDNYLKMAETQIISGEFDQKNPNNKMKMIQLPHPAFPELKVNLIVRAKPPFSILFLK